MQSTVRKLASAAGKASGFDIVLTTYDSLKTKEVTVPLDASGRAILGGTGRRGGASGDDGDGGWLTSRDAGTQSGSSAPQKCQQLSVLHRMSWFRVIFMDVLGRKGESFGRKKLHSRLLCPGRAARISIGHDPSHLFVQDS